MGIAVRNEGFERVRGSTLRRAGRWAPHARPRRSVCRGDHSPAGKQPLLSRLNIGRGGRGKTRQNRCAVEGQMGFGVFSAIVVFVSYQL